MLIRYYRCRKVVVFCNVEDKNKKGGNKNVSNTNEIIIRSRCTLRTPNKKMES